MAKYIGTYSNSGDVQTALNNQELSRPFVVYTTDNNEVIYGPEGDRAEAGDIVVYATGDTLLHYIKQADYNTTSYPATSYVPVGVVVIPQADDVFSGVSGDVTFMAINWLSPSKPDTGHTDSTGLNWGDKTYDIPGLQNYNTSGSAISDMNGKANTEVVLAYATAQTNWKTDSTIVNSAATGYYPLFECSWRYHTSGTVQGDWYIPSCGQLWEAVRTQDTIDRIDAGYALLGITSNKLGRTRYGTSTETNNEKAWSLKDGSYPACYFTSQGKDSSLDFKARAFCSKLMTRI